MPNIVFYRIYGEFAVGFRYNWKVKWIELELGLWVIDGGWYKHAGKNSKTYFRKQ